MGPCRMTKGETMTAATTATAPGAGMRKWGKLLAILGAIVLLLSIVIGTVMAWTGFQGVMDTAEDATPFSGSTTLQLSAGDEIQLYALEGAASNDCDVTPGDQVGPGPSQTSTISKDGQSWTSFDGFTATTDGEYIVACADSAEVLAAPPISVGGILGGVGGIFLGIGGGMLGALLLLIGIVLLLVGRGKAKQAQGV